MSCDLSLSFGGTVEVTSTATPVVTWAGPLGLYVVRVHASKPVRATLMWSEGGQVTDEVTFDVIGVATLIIPASQVSIAAFAHLATSRVEVSILPTTAWAPTTVTRWVPVSSGTTDSATTPALAPPRHADRVDVVTVGADDFDLTLYDDTGTEIGTWDRSTIPADGVALGRAVRTEIAASAPMRLRYTLKV